MRFPHAWTIEELTADSVASQRAFRRERLDEPLELYSEFFERFSLIFSNFVDDLHAIAGPEHASMLAQIAKDDDGLTALRYLGAPPISQDDLKILADVKLSASALRRDAETAQRVRDILLHVLDRHRFPWVNENRTPTAVEREVAVISSAALVAASKVQTDRRTAAKRAQEEAVRQVLDSLGFVEAKRRPIRLLSEAPKPGEYCGESDLGGTQADLIVGLHDRRVLAIECKASNSTVNSFKRLNHEAAGKARTWLSAFGHNAMIPAAVLAGVFSVNNLVAAQSNGIFLFWSHRLEDLSGFLESAK